MSRRMRSSLAFNVTAALSPFGDVLEHQDQDRRSGRQTVRYGRIRIRYRSARRPSADLTIDGFEIVEHLPHCPRRAGHSASGW